MLVNGTEITFPNKPIIVNGTTMVPFRNLLESLKAIVDFNLNTQTITTTANNTKLQLFLGKKEGLKNGQIIQLSQAPYVKDNVTYVPLRFLSESFGYDVDYKNNTIYIKTTGITISSLSEKKPILTVEEIGKIANRVAYIELYNSRNEVFATGSGVVVDSNGGILTNLHVIGEAVKAIVYLNNKQYETNTVLKEDEERDLALIKINATKLPTVTIGRSSTLSLGASVVAIGSPLGLSNTLSTGVVSNVSRNIAGFNFIQTTAPIDHGSSGGALFNMKGELIGITTALIESSASLYFAIPSDDVIAFLDKPTINKMMEGTTLRGEDLAIVRENRNRLFDFLNVRYKKLYNEDILFEVSWSVVDYDEQNSYYILHPSLEDYDQYVELSKYIQNHPEEMGNLYGNLFYAIENFIGLKNVKIQFKVVDRLSFTPDYSLIDSKGVTLQYDNTYTFFYNFSHAIRYENIIEYNAHYMLKNEEQYIKLY